MKRLTAIAALALMFAMPATAMADDAWDEECSGHSAQEHQAVSAGDFQYRGILEDGGRTYSWYSEKVLPGDGLDELNGNGRTVNESGYVVDGEGYIAVASPWGVDEIGTVIETPFGLAKVYDECEDDRYDIYTSWE